jgi:prepilin-type processing-associated H-X9-DG protein
VIDGWAMSSYSGSLGSQWTWSRSSSCQPYAQISGYHYEDLGTTLLGNNNFPFGFSWRKDQLSGIFNSYGFYNRMGFSSVLDGTSNVIMVGEVLINCNDNALSNSRHSRDFGGAWSAFGMGTAHVSTSVPVNTFTTCARSQQDAIDRRYPFPHCWEKANWNLSWGFRSRHNGGVQTVFCDGSVRFVPNTIEYMVYQYIGGRADGRSPTDF